MRNPAKFPFLMKTLPDLFEKVKSEKWKVELVCSLAKCGGTYA